MSHRALDEAVDLRQRLVALDKEIATKALQPVVGIKIMIELKRMRQQLANQIAMREDAAR